MTSQELSTPLLSIVVPVYNTAPYLSECLDSLLGQTLKAIEIICVNDGSTDNSLEILREYERKNDRIVICDQTNQGVSAARNRGVSVATGKYLLFVDSDDYIVPTLAEDSVAFAEQNRCELVNICPRYGCLEITNIPYVRNLANEVGFERCSVYSQITEKQRELFAFFIAGSTHAIVRRDVWNENQIEFPAGIAVNEDFYVFFKLYAIIQNIGFLAPDDWALHYRVRPDSASHSIYVCDKNKKAKIWDIFKVFTGIKEYYIEKGFVSSYHTLIVRYLLAFETMYFNIPREQRKEFKKEVSSCWDDTFDEILDDPQYLPFVRRYFWFWFRGKRIHRKMIGFVTILLRKMKRLLA